MSSPSHDQTITTTERSSSPSRYHNRYAERFKSLSQSPSREPIKTPESSITTYLNNPTRNSPLLEQPSSSYISPLKNSPLQPNRVGEHKIFEDKVEEQVQMNTSPIPKSRSPPTTNINKSEHSHKTVPHYMQATEAFKERVHTAKRRREHDHDNLLRARSKGGITKRVGTSKIPNYRSTTSINAIDDIQSEMTPDDVYIPMAARIKMFEKGLGNASNKPPITPQYSTSTSTASSYNKQHRSPTPSSSSKASPVEYDSSVPRYARPTSATENRKIITPTSTRSTAKKSTRVTESKQVKPFHFVTSERAQHYEQSFNEKLNLWKGKDKLASIESYNNKKRKRDGPNPPPNKTARH